MRDLVARRLDPDIDAGPELQWPTSLYVGTRSRWPLTSPATIALVVVFAGSAGGIVVAEYGIPTRAGNQRLAAAVGEPATPVAAQPTTTTTDAGTLGRATGATAPTIPRVAETPTTLVASTVPPTAASTTTVATTTTSTSTTSTTEPVPVTSVGTSSPPPATTTQVAAPAPPVAPTAPPPTAPPVTAPPTTTVAPTTVVPVATTPSTTAVPLVVQHVNQTDVPGEPGTTCLITAVVSGDHPYRLIAPDGTEHLGVGATAVEGPPGRWRLVAEVSIDATVESNIGGGGCL